LKVQISNLNIEVLTLNFSWRCMIVSPYMPRITVFTLQSSRIQLGLKIVVWRRGITRWRCRGLWEVGKGNCLLLQRYLRKCLIWLLWSWKKVWETCWSMKSSMKKISSLASKTLFGLDVVIPSSLGIHPFLNLWIQRWKIWLMMGYLDRNGEDHHQLISSWNSRLFPLKLFLMTSLNNKHGFLFQGFLLYRVSLIYQHIVYIQLPKYLILVWFVEIGLDIVKPHDKVC